MVNKPWPTRSPFVRRSQLPKVDASPELIGQKLMALAAHPDIRVELITPKYAMMPVYRVDLPAKDMRAGDKPLQAVISGGIHGNEPVGFHAAPAFMKWAAKNKGYRRRFHTTAFIKLDPYGTRDTAYGINRNRSFALKSTLFNVAKHGDPKLLALKPGR